MHSEQLQLVSWNVNGIRSVWSKGFVFWLERVKPHVVCLQETKAHKEQLVDSILNPPGYRTYWHSAEKKGYSSLAMLVRSDLKWKEEPQFGLGINEFDREGRVLSLAWGERVLINAYFPNAQREHGRLNYKLEFNQAMQEFCERWKSQGKEVILCGDFNVAHQEIDLKNPKENQNNAGFLPEERAWMTRFLEAGFVDTFRTFHPNERDRYSWWSFRPGVREKNIGWRLDYFCVSANMSDVLADAEIHPDVFGSDHCPVSLTLSR